MGFGKKIKNFFQNLGSSTLKVFRKGKGKTKATEEKYTSVDFSVDQPSINDADTNKVDVTQVKQQHLLDIFTGSNMMLDQRSILEFTKVGSKCFKRCMKERCRILKFSSDFNFEYILDKIGSVNLAEYPRLFIFIIDARSLDSKAQNSNLFKLKTILLKFSVTRPLIVQVTWNGERGPSIYYKEKNSEKFLKIDQPQINYEKLQDFPSLLHFLKKEWCENREDIIIENFPEIRNLSLVLRFLRSFKFREEFFGSVIIKCAECGSKDDLLAVLDAPFENGGMLNPRAQNYISLETYEDNSADEEETDQEEPTNDSKSVLLTAIENRNKEVIEYLISQCTHLIQQLPFKHQVRISTTAFNTNQLDVLCDLLEFSDFPFPENFKIDDPINIKRLRCIAKNRSDLEAEIKAGNLLNISKFIDENSNLKIIYNSSNKSAMKQAMDAKQYEVYFHLKSLGFEAAEFDDIEEVLRDNELKKARKQRMLQIRKNVENSLRDESNSINLLCTRSFIHNRRITKEQNKKYREKIRQWYKDINKIKSGPEFLNAVSSCEKIKIIFDFDSDSVDHVSLAGPNAYGSTYPSSKWIFIGAKLSDKRREQKIKGVLAHEMCHYAMKLVYENQENPYYKHLIEMAERFEEIVKTIDKWSSEDSECPNDECNEIISSVFRLYSKDEFHLELIVRVVQILVEFDDDRKRLNYLKEKYKNLFDFWYHLVIPEMTKFKWINREKVRKMNRIFEILANMQNANIEFSTVKSVQSLFDGKLVIVKTNVPKLLIVNILTHLKVKFGSLFDAQNVFVDPQKLDNQEILSDFIEILNNDSNLNIIVEYSKDVNVDIFDKIMEPNSIFVVSNENLLTKLEKSIIFNRERPIKIELYYEWNDLTEGTIDMLLRRRINFQNKTNFSFFDLLDNHAANPGETALRQFLRLANIKLLNMLIENQQVTINTRIEYDETTKNFELLFQSRKLTKKLQTEEDDENSEDEWKDVSKADAVQGISQDQLLLEVENKKYILISDIAGTGKSWMMRSVAKYMRDKIPTKWTTHVDLKQFIEELNVKKYEIEFEKFTVDKILKLEQEFEAKLFVQLYQDGKVCILFDGFDELPETCEDCITKLIKSFEYNNGNQMWIATRDYYEIDLQELLDLQDIYKFSELSRKTGTLLIASTWVLYDLEQEGNININCKDTVENAIKNSPNFQRYQELAKKLLNRYSSLKSYAIGFPDFCKYLAEHFKNNKDPPKEVTVRSLNGVFGDYQSERGKPRKTAVGKDYKF